MGSSVDPFSLIPEFDPEGTLSLEQFVAILPDDVQEAILSEFDPEELLYDWSWGARPQQLLDPGDESWSVCLLMAGRGAGKSRAATEWVRRLDKEWKQNPQRWGAEGGLLRGALLSRTAADVRDTLLNGPSGLLHIWSPSEQDLIDWVPSRRMLTLPNGSEWLTMSAEEPDQLRGPAFHVGLADELAAHRGKPGVDGLIAWDNLRIACRMGRTPQIVAATTPKRVPVMRKLVADAKNPMNRILLRHMKTMDNPYLSASYLAVLTGLYAGTSIGAQELDGEMLEDVLGALLTADTIDAYRVKTSDFPTGTQGPDWLRIVGVDPSVAEHPGDECGISVVYAPKTLPIYSRNFYVVDDVSLQASPNVWADVVVKTSAKHDAVVVAEGNQGGALVQSAIKQAAAAANVPCPKVVLVWAKGDKKTRAEPVAQAFEQGRGHFVDVLPEMESQWTEWVPGESGYSPDRLDSCVWAASAAILPDALQKGRLPTTARSISPNRMNAVRAAMSSTQVRARSGSYRR